MASPAFHHAPEPAAMTVADAKLPKPGNCESVILVLLLAFRAHQATCVPKKPAFCARSRQRPSMWNSRAPDIRVVRLEKHREAGFSGRVRHTILTKRHLWWMIMGRLGNLQWACLLSRRRGA